MNTVAEEMFSEKGKKLLVLDNYKFSKVHISNDGKTRWRCSNRKCPMKLYTHVSEENKIIMICGNHNHEPIATISRQKLSN